MNIFEQLEKIDVYIEKRQCQEADDILLATDADTINGMGFINGTNTFLPYSQKASWSMNRDFDHDGIPDALDNYVGSGANAGINPKFLPYSQKASWSMKKDFDQDGIPDALDNHVGPGANAGINPEFLPYSQKSPWSMNTDFDHDGIPDALDNHIGPGAYENDY
ncbi:MAG: hypothetical protein HKUEN01_34650 [Candidatus Kuenenia stuttgartiensis]|nr:MAG: hypothetical protein HKUEN01_34650 [Candidatus Kuenenia stuttgartiensis]